MPQKWWVGFFSNTEWMKSNMLMILWKCQKVEDLISIFLLSKKWTRLEIPNIFLRKYQEIPYFQLRVVLRMFLLASWSDQPAFCVVFMPSSHHSFCWVPFLWICRGSWPSFWVQPSKNGHEFLGRAPAFVSQELFIVVCLSRPSPRRLLLVFAFSVL